MTGQFRGLCKVGAALGAIGLAAAATTAQAQPYDPYYPGDTTVGEIVVVPRNLGRSELGAPIRELYVQRVVSYSDLDLATPWGRDTLRARVRAAARDACDEMEHLRPVTDLNRIAINDNGNCVSRATHNAMRQAEYDTGFRLASY
jgi:UrcA family protein